MRSKKGDWGIDLHTDWSDIKGGPGYVPKECLLHPCFKLWPRQIHQAILWFWRLWVFMWWLNAGPCRYSTTPTSCFGRGRKHISGCFQKFCSTETPFERDEEQASLYVQWHIFRKPDCLYTFVRGTGMLDWNDKSVDWDKEAFNCLFKAITLVTAFLYLSVNTRFLIVRYKEIKK
jgi:hypothetical protein